MKLSWYSERASIPRQYKIVKSPMSVPLRVQNGYKQCFNEAVFILEVGMRISAYFTVLQTTLLLSLLTPALLGGQRRAGVSSRVVCSEVCGNQCAEIHLPTFN